MDILIPRMPLTLMILTFRLSRVIASMFRILAHVRADPLTTIAAVKAASSTSKRHF